LLTCYLHPGRRPAPAARRPTGSPLLSKLESIASSAVRAADKVCAAMIVVYTASGRTAQLVAKYRPPMPILTLVVPHVVSSGLKWTLSGAATARHSQLSRGLLPMLSSAGPSGDAVLEEAIAQVGASCFF
jgi:pyruvate kinase